jgi:hypothetical protein
MSAGVKRTWQGLAAISLAACAYGVHAGDPTGTPLDEVCDPRNGVLEAPVDTITVGWASLEINKGWVRNASNGPRLSLRRIGSLLTVSEGEPTPVPLNQPLRNANRRCEITRRDTNIVITASRDGSTGFSVQAWWETEVDGPFLQLRLQTNNLQDLRRIRGTIESVRFPVDSVRTSRK